MKHIQFHRIAGVLCLCLILGAVAACSNDEGAVTPTPPETAYTYSGFVIDMEDAETVRAEDGTATGKIFLRQNQVVAPLQFAFLDSIGQRVATPSDSAVVLLSPDRTDCIELYPLSMPNTDFGWAFSLNAMKLGITIVHAEFLPDGLCKATDFIIQVPG